MRPQVAAARKEQQLTKARMPRLLAATAALAALTVVGVGGSATAASSSDKAHATVIKMKQDGKELFFDGPATVAAGTVLKIKNTTDPAKIGPHTFSLVKEKEIPTEPADIKACGKKLKGICGAVVLWHKVNLQTGEVGVNPVEAGGKGWDKEGSLKVKGDSWVAEKEGATFKQEVTAEPGTTLHFICVVHPEMQGSITVGD
jgi:plastocyanin